MPAPEVDAIYVAIMLAAIIGGLLARRLTKRDPVAARPWPVRLALTAGLVIGGTLGAKLPFVLGDPEGAVSGVAWISDGRTLTWGLAGGYLGVEIAKLLVGVKEKTGDSYVVPVAVSIAIGRLACFHAGCCHGQPTDLPWGVDFGDGVMRHPNQLYESLFHISMALLALYLTHRGLLRFQRIKLYLISYMGFRFIAEFWRPEPSLAWGLTFYQWSALVLTAVFAGLFWLDAQRDLEALQAS